MFSSCDLKLFWPTLTYKPDLIRVMINHQSNIYVKGHFNT